MTSAEPFVLLGGPLHRLGTRLGLVRNGTNTFRLGLALALLLWGGVVVLALIEGLSAYVFSLTVIAGHVRLLLTIPLMFACESGFAPVAAEFVMALRRWGLIEDADAPALDAEIRRQARRRESGLDEAVCLAAAVLVSVFAGHVGFLGGSAVREPVIASDAVLTAGWYWYVCLPVFRFLAFRWLWRLLRWVAFLWRLARMPLRLDATHPDGAGGLRYLETAQAQFAPLVASLSIVEAAAIAEQLAAGRLALTDTLPSLGFVLLVDAVLFIGPVLFFTPMLWRCRVEGLSRYGGFASRYVRRFDDKWLGTGQPVHGEEVLGNADVQSLADLGSSLERVQEMNLVPVGRTLVVQLAVAAIVPWLPLLLFKYPLTELATTFLHSVVGL